MSPFFQRTDRYGILATLLLATVVAVAHTAGTFRTLDDLVGDAWQRWSNSPPHQTILLVTTPDAFFRTEATSELQRLIHELDSLGAGTIAVSEKCPDMTAARQTSCALLIGGNTDADLALDREQVIYRRFRFGSAQRDFQVRVARLANPSTIIPRANDRIRFCAGLPTVSARRVLDGEMVPELIQNRIVLIGSESSTLRSAFVSPRQSDKRLSEFELRGQIIRCLIAGDRIRHAPALVSWAVVLIIAVLVVGLFRNLNCRWWLLALVGVPIATATLCYASYHRLGIEWPVSALACLPPIAYAVLSRRRYQILRGMVERRRSDGGKGQSAFPTLPSRREREADEWARVVKAWESLFSPTRAAFLELPAGGTHLQVKYLCGVEEGDFAELRRDITRLPFRDAVDYKQVSRLDRQSFFHPSADVGADEFVQFVIPLVVSRPIGVLIMEIEASRLRHWSDFDNQALDLASESAAYLASEQSRRAHSNKRVRWSRRLGELPEQRISSSIVADANAIRNATQTRTSTLDSLSTAIAVSDAFGRVVYANVAMTSLLEDRGLPADDRNAIDWLRAISGRSARDCSELLRRTSLLKRTETLHCRPATPDAMAPILTLKPIDSDRSDQELEHHFVVLEVLVPESMKEASRWETRFARSREHELRGQARECAEPAQPQPINGENPDGEWMNLVDQVDEISTVCHHGTKPGLAEDAINYTDLPLSDLLSTSLRGCVAAAEEQGLALAVESCDDLPRVHVNPFLLSRVIRNQFQCATAGADPGEQIRFTSKHRGGYVECIVYSAIDEIEDTLAETLGIDDVLNSLPTDLADDFRSLRETVRHWGGDIAIAGGGVHSVMTLLRLRVAPSSKIEDAGTSEPDAIEAAPKGSSTDGAR